MWGKRFILVLALWGACGNVPAADFKKNKSSGAEALFREGNIRTFRLELPEASLLALKIGNRIGTRDYVRATLREGDTVLRDVGLRLKGHSSFQDIDRRPNFSLKLNEFVTGQEYRGLNKLVLNNSAEDPGLMREIVAVQLYRDAGLPAPMVTHARVELNGRELGFYLLVEPINKGFLKREFGSASGNLYEGESRDIDQKLDQENGEDTSQRDLKALLELLKTPSGVRLQKLGPVLDVDEFTTFLALEMLTAGINGYAYMHNNYRIYHDPKTDKLRFLPHGLEATFGSAGFQPPTGSLVVKALWELPEFQSQYHARLGELTEKFWRVETLTNRVRAAAAKLITAAPDRKFADLIRGEELNLRRQIVKQHELVKAELGRVRRRAGPGDR